MAENPSDEALHERIRQGDMAAFDALYARYERRLFGFILRLVHSRADAEDLFHEAFLRVLAHPEVQAGTDPSDGGRFCAWVFRIARNLCYNHLRSQRRLRERHDRLAQVAPPAASPEDGLRSHQADRQLANAVAQLPVPLFEVYHLRAQGLSYEDMAVALEIPLGTVKSRMNQMVKQLQAGLRHAENPP